MGLVGVRRGMMRWRTSVWMAGASAALSKPPASLSGPGNGGA